MSTVTPKDGTQIFHKDWGPKSAQPIMFAVVEALDLKNLVHIGQSMHGDHAGVKG